jgi:hypothetical protein
VIKALKALQNINEENDEHSSLSCTHIFVSRLSLSVFVCVSKTRLLSELGVKILLANLVSMVMKVTVNMQEVLTWCTDAGASLPARKHKTASPTPLPQSPAVC